MATRFHERSAGWSGATRGVAKNHVAPYTRPYEEIGTSEDEAWPAGFHAIPLADSGAAATQPDETLRDTRRIHHLHTRIDCDRFPFPFPIFVHDKTVLRLCESRLQHAPRTLTSIHTSRV